MLIPLLDVLEGKWIVLNGLAQMRELDSELFVVDDFVEGDGLFLVRVQTVLLVVQRYYHFVRCAVA
jgi:hypothetical protein